MTGSSRAKRRSWSERVTQSGLMFTPNRPPMFLDYSGNLYVWDTSRPAGHHIQDAMKDSGLAAMAWDDSGEWLALGHRDGRAWLTRPSQVNTWEGASPLRPANAGQRHGASRTSGWGIGRRSLPAFSSSSARMDRRRDRQLYLDAAPQRVGNMGTAAGFRGAGALHAPS